LIFPFLYDTIKIKNFIKKREKLMIFNIIIIAEMIIFLIALLYEMITMPTIVIREEDE
jgi:hypothetical protein